jgi:thiamine transporter ThiT
MTPVKRLVTASICCALCVVLPIAFHIFPEGGSVLLPMHIPVLLCGLACGWPYGLVCGLLGPLLSHLFTQMPPMAVLPGMMVECGVYGLVTGLGMKYIRTGKAVADLYISMGTAMVLGRVVSGLAKALIFAPGTPAFAWVTTSLVAGIPGIVIQLVLMPLLIMALTRAKLLPKRYPQRV